MSSGEKLRQILDEHELYKSVQKMSSYAAGASSPILPNISDPLRLPRAHLEKTTITESHGKPHT